MTFEQLWTSTDAFWLTVNCAIFVICAVVFIKQMGK